MDCNNLAALAREIRWRPWRLRFHVVGKMRLDLSCSCGQIHADRFQVIALHFRFGLHDLPTFRFHFVLKVALPIIASPNHVQGGPEGQSALEKARSLDSAIATGLLDPPDKTVHLPQRLLLARLEEVHKNARTVLRPGEWCEMPRALPRLPLAEQPALFARPTANLSACALASDMIKSICSCNGTIWTLFFEAGRSGRARPRE